jgi:hypothetical protein
MKRLLMFLLLISIFTLPLNAYSADSIVLTDNTLVTDSSMLECLKKSDTETVLLMTGIATDTFAVIEDGVTVQTVTLAASAEKWQKFGGIRSFKVNWTAVAGSPAATLQCNRVQN